MMDIYELVFRSEACVWVHAQGQYPFAVKPIGIEFISLCKN